MKVPASVRDYLNDGGIRHAISEILRLDARGEVLPSLEWREMPRYYEALSAAQRFRIDWMLFSQEAWGEVWSDLVRGWKPWKPYDQVDSKYDVEPTPANCCDTEGALLWFGRYFDRDGWTLGASIGVEPGEGLRVRVDCAGDHVWERVRLANLADELEGLEVWSSHACVELDDDTVDLSNLRDVAAAMLAEVDRQIAEGFSKPVGRKTVRRGA